MIRLSRPPEPPELRSVREKRLPDLRALIHREGRDPESKEIKGYNLPSVRKALCHGQSNKCCYCEDDVEPEHDPVEHYRPKSNVAADGAVPSRAGYWWLAYSWDNLLYSCNCCNGHKGTKFPLNAGSTPLRSEEAPPGLEEPLLLNPYDEHPDRDPVQLIQFRRRPEGGVDNWIPYARTGDERAKKTITEILKLDRGGLLKHYRDHVRYTVMPKMEVVKQALRGDELRNGSVRPLWKAFYQTVRSLLAPGRRFSSLSYDALRHFVPDTELRPHLRRGWPRPPARL